jgi:hypothetical protein
MALVLSSGPLCSFAWFFVLYEVRKVSSKWFVVAATWGRCEVTNLISFDGQCHMQIRLHPREMLQTLQDHLVSKLHFPLSYAGHISTTMRIRRSCKVEYVRNIPFRRVYRMVYVSNKRNEMHM